MNLNLIRMTMIALVASAFAPTAAAHEECCSPFIELDGFTTTPTGGGGTGGGPDLPIDNSAIERLAGDVHATATRAAQDVRQVADDLRRAIALPVDPIPPPEPDYYGATTVDVSFREGCRCEILDAWITWTEIADGNDDAIGPVLTQIDGDSWLVSAGDFDTYEITFHVVYDCGEGPHHSTRSWTQYN